MELLANHTLEDKYSQDGGKYMHIVTNPIFFVLMFGLYQKENRLWKTSEDLLKMSWLVQLLIKHVIRK